MAMADNGTAGQAATTTSPEDELRVLRDDHKRLMDHTGKLRAELLGMLREDCARLEREREDLSALRQYLIDIRPRDRPADPHDEMQALMRQKEELARARALHGYPATALMT